MGEGFGESEETGRALVAVERSRFMPAMSIESAVERYNAVTEFVSRVLRKDVDYGVIPGTDKRTLLKPGAEKDRKSTRLNSSHANISYAVFCLKKKNKIIHKH